MPKPPKPKGAPDDLHEVERALSVLQGRHPDHERARREDEAARKRRAADLASRAHVETSAARSRSIRVAAIAVPVLALVIFVGVLAKRELARRARVEQAAAPFRAFGFAGVETSSPSSTGVLEAGVEPGCMMAVTSGGEPVEIARGGVKTKAASPALFCTCAPERIGLSADVGSGGGVALMRAEAATIGGSRAFAYAPFTPAAALRTDEACSDASLDAWVAARRFPAPLADGPWLMGWPRRAPLVAAGFEVVAIGAPALPFVVVEIPKDSCALVTSSVPGDRVSLRLEGAVTVPETAGTIARCAQAGGTAVVSREGTGELVVLLAPSATIGGMQGVRDVARENGLTVAASSVPSADLAWDAKQVLLASQVPEAFITTDSTPDVAVDAEPRVAVLSFETPNALAPEMPDDTYSYCDPPLDPSMRHATCVFSGSQKWRTAGGEAVGGIARAKLPFWLFAMQSVNDPKALRGMTQLFALARRLARDGFAPTTLEAVVELPSGVEVLGRTGEDAIVAVGVAPAEPFVYALTDGTPWSLDDAPRIIALRPLEKVTLTAIAKVLPAKPSRRTVVFRRQKRAERAEGASERTP